MTLVGINDFEKLVFRNILFKTKYSTNFSSRQDSDWSP